MIYLDYAASSPLLGEVKHRIFDTLAIYGNPSSTHAAGAEARKIIDGAKKNLLDFLGAKEGDIIFTSGGTEANNLAILGLEDFLRKSGKTTIVTSKIEHPSVLKAYEHLEGKGFNVIYMPVHEDGRVDIEDLHMVIEANMSTLGLVSIQTVNSEIGTVQNIEDIGGLCRDYDILFHTDAVQGVGHVEIDVEKCCIDLLSMSGHKLGTPKGVGALYVRYKKALSPLVYGGGQEYGLRSGTENVLGIAALDAAVKTLKHSSSSHFAAIDLFHAFILDELEISMKVPFFINNADGRTHIVSLTIPKVEGSSLALLLNEAGICVSTGSACSSGSLEPSYVLKAIGLSDKDAVCTIRISFLPYVSSLTDIQKAIQKIAELSKQLYELAE